MQNKKFLAVEFLYIIDRIKKIEIGCNDFVHKF